MARRFWAVRDPALALRAMAVAPSSHCRDFDPSYILGGLATPEAIRDWSLTRLREKFIKIAAVCHLVFAGNKRLNVGHSLRL
jgi:hypothetical protein